MRARITSIVLPAIGVLCLGLFWTLLALNLKDLPSPLKTWQESKIYILQPLEKRGEMDQGILLLAYYSLFRVGKGFLLGALMGTPLGFLLGLSATARRYSLASIEVLRPMPGVAFAPVGLLLFGFSLKTEMVVTILPVLWPVLVNTMGGVTGVHQRLYDVGRTFRLSRKDTILRIILPAAMPPIVVGARISLGLALVLAVVAEMVGNPEGLGYGIVREQQALRPDLMFAYIVTVGFIGIVLNAAMLALAEALFPSFRQLRGAP